MNSTTNKINRYPPISVIIPFRNEEQYIKACVSSLLNGGYPKDRLEFILVDGMSNDASIKRISEIKADPAIIKIITNPKIITPAAMNLGVKQASADILVWAGAHAKYHSGYLQQSVRLLINKRAASVGGVIQPVGTSDTGNAIAFAAKSPFGVGNAQYRLGRQAGWVDTVFAGCFNKKDILAIGGFNEAWVVNQDGELNFRLRKHIGKIYLSPEIKCDYYVRETYHALAKQYFCYGFWRTKTLLKHPDSFSLRQLVPPLFVIALIMSTICLPFSRWPLVFLLLAYLFSGLFFILRCPYNPQPFIARIRILAAFLSMHLAWGVGFLWGMIKNTLIK